MKRASSFAGGIAAGLAFLALAPRAPGVEPNEAPAAEISGERSTPTARRDVDSRPSLRPVGAEGRNPFTAGREAARQRDPLVDLRQLPRPSGAKVTLLTAAMVDLETQISPIETLKFYQQEFVRAGWALNESSLRAASDASQRALFEKACCSVTLSIVPGDSPRQSRVALRDRGDLDTRQLPRVDGSELVTASRPVTIFASWQPPAQVAEGVTRSLARQGWNRYKEADAQDVAAPGSLLWFRQAGDSLCVSIAAPKSNGGATRVSYSVRRLAHPTPTPAEAADIELNDARWEVRCQSLADAAAVTEFYQQALGEVGFRMSGGGSSKLGEKLLRFERDDRCVVLVRIATVAGKTAINLHGFTAEQLADLPKASKPKAADVITLYAQDLPLPAGARQVKYAPQSEEITFSSGEKLDDVVKDLRARLLAAGWQEKADASLLAEGAGIVEFQQGDSSLIIMVDELDRGAGTAVTITGKGMAWR